MANSPPENMLTDEIHRISMGREKLILNDNRLEQHHAVWPQQSARTMEEGIEVVANGFDHFNRNEFVVLTPQIAVIAIEYLDTTGQLGLADSRCRQAMLLLGDCGCAHVAAMVSSGVDSRESAPAGPDLNHVIGWLQVELATDTFQLGNRGLVK